jgi:hypothetical protein
LLRSNSQVEIANRLGDVLGTNATHTVGNAAKDACHEILADWAQHGRLTAPDEAAAPSAAPAPTAAAATSSQPAAKLQTAVQTQDAEIPTAPAPGANPDSNTSFGDAARHQQQLKACQALAKDNPSVVCK